jgi:hypothetical protein
MPLFITRKTTKKLISLIDEGMIDQYQVVIACLNYMSEDDVAHMCHVNDFLEDEDENEEEPK